jgi:hypothetical protein
MKRDFLGLAFAILVLANAASATILDSCDSMTLGNGDWAIMDDYGGSLGSTATLNSSINIEGSACVEFYATEDSYNTWAYKMYRPQGWDLSDEPILKFRIYPTESIPVNEDSGMNFGTTTGEPDTWGWHSHNYDLPELIEGQWNEVEIDLRTDNTGSPLTQEALSMVQRLSWGIYNYHGTPFTFYIDWIETLPGDPIPTGSITITVMSNGEPLPGVSVEVGSIVALTDSNGQAIFTDLFVGDYLVQASKFGYVPELPFTMTVLEGQTALASIDLEKLPHVYSLPVTRLHVEGKYVKDENGNIVYLRGVNSPGYIDTPGGWWTNYNVWEPDEIRAHMRSMKEWGFNALRMFIQPKWWMQDNVDFNGQTYDNRQNVKDTLQIAQEEGMYVIITGGWGVVPINEPGHQQVSMPFPPYLTAEEEAIIPSEQYYVDYCLSVIDEIKGYPNAIFELWNEPNGNDAAAQDWFRATQSVIDGARQLTDMPILVHWGYGVYANLDYGSGFKMDWVENYPLSDPAHNLIYSTHVYRYHGFCHRSDSVPTEDRDRWEYDEIETCYNVTLVNHAANELKVPIVVGEIGATSAQREMEYFENSFDIFNRWGIGYLAWWWRPDGIFGLIDSRTSRMPNSVGNILIDGIARGGTYAVNFTGTVTDKNGTGVNANVTLVENDTAIYVSTDASGYSIVAKPGVYDVFYNVSDIFMKLSSVNITSHVYHKLDKIDLRPNRTSLIFDVSGDQTIELSRPEKPKVVLKNTTILQEYPSLVDLGPNEGWYYDTMNQIVYVNFSRN